MEQSRGEHGVERHEEYPEGFVKHTETGEYFDVSNAPFERMDKPDLSGYYEHYKSTPEKPMFYWVSHVVQNTVTGEKLVIYKPLYETAEKVMAARPLDMFLGTVVIDGVKTPRFHRIHEEP